MALSRITFAALLFAHASAVHADAPTVVTDFVPTNEIVERVMQGVGTSLPLLLPNDTPHHFAMRPSHAQLLTDADIVIWVGAELTPWLAEPIETLALNAISLPLLETEGWDKLPMRGLHDEADGHDHGHDHGHSEDAHDPHAWLDPDIAAVWALNIAEVLSEADPDNALIYQANANQFWADVALLGQDIESSLADLDGSKILVPHDSLQYFETRFGFQTAGAIADGDAADPGPAHLRDMRAKIETGEITCVLGDVETNPGTLTTLTEGTDAKTGMLDLTDRKTVGYVAMMQSIVATLNECAS